MNSYKSLVVWQRAEQLSLATLEIVDAAWQPRCAAIFDQLRRAAVSVDVNIVEGSALNTPARFRRHLRIALGSAAETERLLSICLGRGCLTPNQGEPLLQLADATIATLFGLIRSPKLSRNLP